jgi:hypothetical protein
MDINSISWVRTKMPEKMAREMFWQAAQYFEPLGRLVRLWEEMDLSQSHEQRIRALQQNLEICRNVDWKEASRFSILLNGLLLWFEENPQQLPPLEIRNLALKAIEVAETSSEMIQDGHNWQMCIDDLQAFLETMED